MMELFRPGKEREVSKHARQRLMRLRHAFRLKKRKGDDGTALNGGRLPRLESLRKILSPVFAIRTRSDSSKSIIRRIFDTIAQSYYVLVPFVTLALFIGNQEGWTIITSIYYAMATASTVGWGDMAPTHPKMRLLSLAFIPLAVISLGEILGRIAGYFIRKETNRAERDFMDRRMVLADLEAMDTNGDGMYCNYDHNKSRCGITFILILAKSLLFEHMRFPFRRRS
mmetsp:Transcript_22273/g.28558  ORF Transcript_22273/g.28558 Transcript_22273/m.28558 type:complete len:226 (-) Transcript_22273:564-1241(-)